MKTQLWIGLLVVSILSSCSSTKYTLGEHAINLEPLKRQEYTVLDNISGEGFSTKFWILGFPLSKKKNFEKKATEVAINNALKLASNLQADGVLTPRSEYKKKFFSLLLFSWQKNKVTITGKAFKIKTDKELAITNKASVTESNSKVIVPTKTIDIQPVSTEVPLKSVPVNTDVKPNTEPVKTPYEPSKGTSKNKKQKIIHYLTYFIYNLCKK